jgi:hypothetical protein
MRRFDTSRCIIPEVWCGNGNPPNRRDRRYTRNGTKGECLKKGIGAGMAIERAKVLPPNSLQTIKYVGETYENNFMNRHIRNTDMLIRWCQRMTAQRIDNLLRTVFQKANGVIDMRAFNSTILFLYKKGIRHVPQCSQL